MTPPPPCAEFPPPPPFRVSPRYVVLNTSADLVLEARFRGNFYAHEWVYTENDPTFLTSLSSLFTPATVTNIGQTYTIPAGSASLRVGYYGPRVLPTLTSAGIRPIPENTVIVGSFSKCTTTDSVAPQVKTCSELVSKQEMVVVLAQVYNVHLSIVILVPVPSSLCWV